MVQLAGHRCMSTGSDAFKRSVRQRRKRDIDRVCGADDSSSDDNAHDPSELHQRTMGITDQNLCEKPILKVVDLRARIAQAGYRDKSGRTDLEYRSDGQVKQLDAPGSDVLTQVTGTDIETLRGQVIEEFRVDQMHLAQVWLGRISGDSRAMLNPSTVMGITFNPEPGHQIDLVETLLAEVMDGRSLHRQNRGSHWFPS